MKSFYFLFFLPLLLCIQGCEKADPESVTKKCLVVVRTSYVLDHSAYNRVSFNSNSPYDLDTYTWDFGDGTTLSNKEFDPIHIYPEADATYSVRLSGKNKCGDIISKDTTVVICSSCFEYRAVEGNMNYTAKLSGKSDKILSIQNQSVDSNNNYGTLRINQAGWQNYLMYLYGGQSGIGKLSFYLGDTMQKTAYRWVPVGQYNYNGTNLNQTARLDIYYGISGTSGFFIGKNGTGSVQVTRSDSLVAGSFVFSFVGDAVDIFSGKPNTTGTANVTGSFEITKTKRYYYP